MPDADTKQAKLAAEVTPYLEPGEKLNAVLQGHSGPRADTPTGGMHLLALTDRNIVVVKTNWRGKAKTLIGRFPLQPFGPPLGQWSETTLGGKNYYIQSKHLLNVLAD